MLTPPTGKRYTSSFRINHRHGAEGGCLANLLRGIFTGGMTTSDSLGAYLLSSIWSHQGSTARERGGTETQRGASWHSSNRMTSGDTGAPPSASICPVSFVSRDILRGQGVNCTRFRVAQGGGGDATGLVTALPSNGNRLLPPVLARRREILFNTKTLGTSFSTFMGGLD